MVDGVGQRCGDGEGLDHRAWFDRAGRAAAALGPQVFQGLRFASLFPLVHQDLIQHWKARETSIRRPRTPAPELDSCDRTVIMVVVSDVFVVDVLQLHSLFHRVQEPKHRAQGMKYDGI